MCSFSRCVLRWGLVGALGLGGVTLLVGPERVATGFAQLRARAQHVVDRHMDDPFALRRELQHLADEYPDRIAEVRGEIAEVDHQLNQISRDVRIAQEVVVMTTDDLMELKTLVARAEAAQQSNARPASIRFEGVVFDIDEAYAEANRINDVRQSYKNRLAYDRQQEAFLTEQKQRLTEILNKLETDFNTYQTQLWALDRQIDAIERNERLIELTEQQQATLNELEKFGQVGNLKQLQGKLEELKTRQIAQLEALRKKSVNLDYEDRARFEIESGDVDAPYRIFDQLDEELNGEDDESDDARSASHDVAFAAPIIIENN